MHINKLSLSVLQQGLAICKFESSAPIPEWINGGFYSVTKTSSELSIVCEESRIPKGVDAAKGWRAFKIEATLDLSLTGILESLLHPLAVAEISVFAISTHDTDYVLVRVEKFDEAMKVLKQFCDVKS